MSRRTLIALTLLACACPAAAQGTVQFFPRYDFHLGAEHLSQDDPRFVWDTNFGGEMDLVDYGAGRATFAANYEAVLGNQLRAFDPNQANYLLDASLSVRAHGAEIAAVLHHTSRHLSDRFKAMPVDWNMLGAVVSGEIRHGTMLIRPHGNVLDVLLKSDVDYRWETNAGVDFVAEVRPHISLVSRGNVRVVGVDGSRPRGTQTGSRVESGIRLEGTRGAIELYVAGERRIDAYPLDFSSLSWLSAGFRFVSR